MSVLVGVERFAELYGCSVEHARRMCREGKAPRHYKFGRTIRFQESDILEWMKAHAVNPENK